MTMLVLYLLKTNTFVEKQSSKRGPAGVGGLGKVKIVLTLLTKIVVIYV